MELSVKDRMVSRSTLLTTMSLPNGETEPEAEAGKRNLEFANGEFGKG